MHIARLCVVLSLSWLAALCQPGHQDKGPGCGDDEMMTIACRVEFFLHYEAKMFFLSASVGAGDCQCILVGLLLSFLHAGICRFAIIAC